ncbi:MAG: hypothetical protein LBG60_07435, partial [Bifidobacteriaceae bacterium]|nr:hypothetical protein [Bifidobacteriaceae bacterium]
YRKLGGFGKLKRLKYLDMVLAVAAVVMHAEGGGNSQEVFPLPFDAGKYGLYLSGGSPGGELTPSTQTISGDWVVFGATGYMAAVIQTAGDFADQPFDKHVLEITVRSNAVLAAEADEDDEAEETGEQTDQVDTFAQYDQWRIFFNPIAAEAQIDDAVADLATPAGAVDFYVGKIADKIDPALDESLKLITTDMRAMVAARAAIDQAADEVSTTPVLTRAADGTQAMTTLAKPAVPDAVKDDRLAKTDATGSAEAAWLADQAAIAGAEGAWVEAGTLPRGAVADPRVWERPWGLDRWRAIAAWSQMAAPDVWAEDGQDAAPAIPAWQPDAVAWDVKWPDGQAQPLLEISILDPAAFDQLTAAAQPWANAVSNYVALRKTLVNHDLGELVEQAVNITATTGVVTVNQGVLKQFG